MGVDDRGESPGSEVTTTIPAGASRTFTAAALESGGEGFEGLLVAVEMRGYLANSPRELTVPVEANQR